MKPTTYVFENPNLHYDFVCTGFSEGQAREELKRKLTALVEKGEQPPLGGWTLKTKHNDENSDPSMDRNVQYTNWDFR